ncbi:hypothetical protein E9993_17220 [Labilibacter sediminis]|nr:hypothetical protein E9993_17220 [Labilibacter sediminis]
MEKKEDKDRKFETLMQNALSDQQFYIPDNFADRLTQKFNIRNMKHRLLTEWGLKLLIIIGVTGGSALVFILSGSDIISSFIHNYYPIILILIITVFIFFFDQVLLKLMFFLKDIKKHNSK